MSRVVIYINSMNASGGIERVVSNLAPIWSETNDLVLLTKDEGESFYALPSSIRLLSTSSAMKLDMTNRLQRIASTAGNLITTRRSLKDALDTVKPDYIYVTSPFNALEVFLLGEGYRRKLVVSEHGSFYGYNKVYTAVKKHVYPRSYCISVPNMTDVAIYRSWNCNAVFIPHPLTSLSQVANSLDTKVLLNIGRLTPDKRQELLVDMWSRIEDKKGWELWIVGEGELREALEEKVNRYRLEGSVKLLGATKDIASIYKQASAFAFSSMYEGFGMVLLEAMSFGIPCVSFDCPSGPRDVIVDGGNGFLVEDGNEKAFAEAIERLIAMTDAERRLMGANAREFVRAWDNGAIARMWDKVFNKEDAV